MPRAPTVLLASLALLGGAALSSQVLADGDSSDGNSVGYYIGAGVGATHIDQNFFDSGIDDFRSFDDSRFGWKVLMGLRPIEWLGAEAEYIDFGDTNLGASPLPLSAGGGTSGAEFYGAHASATAGAGFAVAYLPLPPSVDLFGKLGFARVQTRYSYAGDYPTDCGGSGSTCTTLRQIAVVQDNTNTGVAYGAGAQFHFGAFAVRLEYERVNGAWQPGLLSLGLTWVP
ncbi:MAG: outer membrane beta-barrel protein [Steroidobacteraceae bacterium]